jgi:hypothetical protein
LRRRRTPPLFGVPDGLFYQRIHDSLERVGCDDLVYDVIGDGVVVDRSSWLH